MANSSDLCDPCKATGLAMHLALALPVPKTSGGPPLPSWAALPQVTSIALTDYQYTLRALRAGYLYVFFKKNARGQNKWQAWSVSEDGQAYPMSDPQWMIPIADLKCHRKAHSSLRLHHIVIEDPHLCETAWIAFSEHQWSAETRKRYAEDETLRSSRMQAFEPAQLIASDKAAAPGITPATPAALEAICDYMPSFNPAQLPYDKEARVTTVSLDETGSYSAVALATHSTRYPWATGRRGTAAKACDMLRLRSRKQDGTPHPGVVMALADAVGCTHELNGYRNDVVGRITQFVEERELQVMAYNAIQGLEKALEQRAGQIARDASETGMFKWTPENTAKRMKTVQAKYAGNPERIRRELDLCQRWELDSQQGIPLHIARQREFYLALPKEKDWLERQAQIDTEARKYTTPTVKTGKTIVEQREARSQAWETKAREGAWPKYREKIDPEALKAFKKNWDALHAEANSIIDKRTVELIKWLEAPAFLAALEDFASNNIADGVAFDDKVGSAILGIGSTKTGRAKIDAWVAEMSAKPGNLFWRAIALNQKEGIDELNTALAHAKAGLDVALTAESWAKTCAAIKWNKLADLYKKAQGLSNANLSAQSSKGKVAQIGGIDKVLISAGDRVFRKFFSPKIDSFISEKVVQSVFLIRANGEIADLAIDLVAAEAKADAAKLDRYARMRRVYSAQAFTSMLVDEKGVLRAPGDVLKEKWAKLVASADKPDKNGKFNAAKDARLAFVVAALEAYNLAKCGYEVGAKQDLKSLFGFSAAIFSLSASTLDIYANVIKGSFDDKALPYQRLKFLGGGLGAASAIMGIGANAMATYQAAEDELGPVFWLNVVSTGLSLGSAVIGATTALASCGEYLTAVAARQHAAGFAGARVTSGLAGIAVGRALTYRTVLMASGIFINIVVLGIQVAIWHLSDDELQEWCSKCYFGKKRDKEWTVKKQSEQLHKSLYLAGVSA